MKYPGWITALIVALAWSVQGAPIMPPQQAIELPEEVRSLAGITKVRLTIADLPEALTARGLRKQQLRKRCITRLAREGITVLDDPALPRMDLWMKQFRSPVQPDVVAFTSVIAVFQPVRVHRLNRDMVVPTACFAGATLLDRNMLVEDAVRKLVGRCGNIAQMIAQVPVPDAPETP